MKRISKYSKYRTVNNNSNNSNDCSNSLYLNNLLTQDTEYSKRINETLNGINNIKKISEAIEY